MSVLVYGVDNGEDYSDNRMLRFFSSVALAKAWIAKVRLEERSYQKQSETHDDGVPLRADEYRITEWPVDACEPVVSGWDAAPWNRDSNSREVKDD